MLPLVIPKTQLFNEKDNTFINVKEQTIQLEHSLVSLSKWESKWHKPFLTDKAKTHEETLDYIKCMTITQNVKDEVYLCLNNDHVKEINDYITNPMTATTINDKNSKKINNEQITAELIYYWMITLNIPFKCEKWHLNRLITLVKVCNVKNEPPKKMSKRDIMSRNAALNAARRKQLNTKG